MLDSHPLRFLVLLFALGSPLTMQAEQVADAPATEAAKIPTGSPSLDEQLTALEIILTEDAKANPSSPSAVGRVVAIRRTLQQKNYNVAIAFANNISTIDPSEPVQKAVAALVAAVEKARDAENTVMNDQAKAALDHATQAVLSAKDPKELDSVLEELSTATTQSRSGNYNQAAYLQLEGASRFVQAWQSYLVDKSAGNSMQVSNDLRMLANENGSFMPIPRSEILELALKESGHETQAINGRIQVRSFDDIPGAINQLQVLQRSGNYSMEMNNLMNSLQSLQNAYAAYQDKNYTAALQQLQSPFGIVSGAFSGQLGAAAMDKSNGQDGLAKELAVLKDTLLLEIVQGLLALPDAPAPQSDEHAAEYLLRLAAVEKKAADWPVLQQVLMVYQQAFAMFNPQSWLQEDLNGLRAYLIGEKLETAGQNLDAIRSYRQALATLGRFFPADPAAAKLKDLQKQFPELYLQALQQPIEPRGP